MKVFELNHLRGSMRDRFGNSITNNGVTLVRDRMLTGLYDGKTDFLNINSVLTASLSTTTTGTWISWVKLFDASGLADETVLSFGDTNANERIHLYITAAGLLRADLIDAGTIQWDVDTDAAAFVDKFWTHIALVQDGVSPVLYVNGVAVEITFNTNTDTTAWFSVTTGLDNGRIGALNFDSAGEDNNLGGRIPMTRLFNHALTQAEIDADYEEFLRASNHIPAIKNFAVIKPDDLSHVPNLAGAYNMIPQGGNLRDISGNANVGIINGAPMSTKNGIKLNGSSDFININTLNGDLASTTVGTWIAIIKPVDATPAGNEQIIGFSDTNANELILFEIQSNGHLRGLARIAGTTQWTLPSDDVVFSDNTWTYIALVQDGTFPVLYVDGVEIAQTLSSGANDGAWFNGFAGLDNGRIGDRNFNSGGETNHFEGELEITKIFSTNYTAAQIAADFNEWARRKLLNETFDGVPADAVAGLTHLGSWRVDSGTFIINEDATSKFIDCTSLSDGTISIEIDLANYVGNGFILSLAGSLSAAEGGTVSAGSNIAFANGRLTLTLAPGQLVRNVIIQRAATV